MNEKRSGHPRWFPLLIPQLRNDGFVSRVHFAQSFSRGDVDAANAEDLGSSSGFPSVILSIPVFLSVSPRENVSRLFPSSPCLPELIPQSVHRRIKNREARSKRRRKMLQEEYSLSAFPLRFFSLIKRIRLCKLVRNIRGWIQTQNVAVSIRSVSHFRAERGSVIRSQLTSKAILYQIPRGPGSAPQFSNF